MKKAIFALVALCAIGGSALAGTPGLDAREANQRARIQQGVASGELTRPEARRLVRGEVRLHRAERRAKSDGSVSASERVRLHRAANQQSKRIFRQKHDAQDRG